MVKEFIGQYKNEYVKLGDLCKTTSGGTPSRRVAKYYMGSIPWVKSGELDQGLIINTEEKISEEAVKNSSAKIFPKGTLLIALYGATIGKLAFLGIEAATNQAICGIFENDKINSKYLYYYLLSKRQDLINEGIGGAQPNISQTILRNLDVPLPDIKSQQFIVTKIEELFSELDKGIENLKLAQEQLKVYRQAVLKWAFEGRLTNENVKEGELPEGWKWGIFSDINSIKANLVNPKDYLDSPHIAPDNISKGTAKLLPYKTIKGDKVFSAKHKFFKGQILYSKIRPNLSKLIIAPFDGLCSADMYPIESVYENKFTLYYMLTNSFVANASNTESRTILPKINQKGLNEIPFPICSNIEQAQVVYEIENRLSISDKMEENLNQVLQQTEIVKQSILKNAFSAQILQ